MIIYPSWPTIMEHLETSKFVSKFHGPKYNLVIVVVVVVAVQEMGKEVESEKEGRPSYQHWT